MNVSQLNRAINAALNAVSSYQSAITQAREALGRTSRTTARETIIPMIAKFYGIGTKASESNANKGALVFEGDEAPKMAAMQATNRLLKDIFGPVKAGNAHSKPVNLPRGLQANIVAQIIGAGLDKKQFDALIAGIREAVTFK